MNDRPDWLTEPVLPPRQPLSERLHLAAASVASLALGVVGVTFVGLALYVVVAIASGFARHYSSRSVMSYAITGATMMLLAYLMRWCLRRARHEAQRRLKTRSDSADNQPHASVS